MKAFAEKKQEMIKRYIYALLGLLLFVACRKDDDNVQLEDVRQATVTYLVTPNGLGDNGQNDDAAEGIFAFAKETIL